MISGWRIVPGVTDCHSAGQRRKHGSQELCRQLAAVCLQEGACCRGDGSQNLYIIRMLSNVCDARKFDLIASY